MSLISVIGFYLSIGIFIVTLALGVTQGDAQQKVSESVFTRTSESVFLGVRAIASNSQTDNGRSLGSITLKNSSTILVTPTASHSVSGSLGPEATAVSVVLPNSHYTLTGSFSKDNKSWCFDLKEKDIYEAIYNENGLVASSVHDRPIGSAVCSQGATFNANGKLVK